MDKILMIDDDMDLLGLYGKKLAAEGFAVQTATDGETGLALALKEHPDLILLDVNMPKMDGIMVMKKLRGDQWGRTVPIIIVSSMDTDDKRLRSVGENEPAYYLLKPNHTLMDVMVKIKEVLARPSR